MDSILSSLRLLGLFVIAPVVFSKELSCNQSSLATDEVIEFKSPGFPNFLNEDLTCEVWINLTKNYKHVRVDFVNVTMDGQGVFGGIGLPGLCESDMFFFKGFDRWTPPPKCGELTGYSFLFEPKMAKLSKRTFKIVALMSSRQFSWHIRIKQVTDFQTRRRKHHTSMKKKSRVIRNPNNDSSQTKCSNTSHPIKFISAGTDDTNITAPWLVSIRQKKVGKHQVVRNCSAVETEGLHFCGGTIINRFFIVTAAHCLYGRSKFFPFKKLDSLKVVVGDRNVCKDNSGDPNFPSFDHDVESVIFYYGHDPQMQFHDIAVIKLKTKITFMSHISPVEMNEEDEEFKDTEGQISGFGAWDKHEEGYSVQQNFLKSTTQYFPYSPQVLAMTINSSFVCWFTIFRDIAVDDLFTGDSFLKKYEYLGTDLCEVVFRDKTMAYEGAKAKKGDSGGPLVSFHGEEKAPRLSGIILKTKNTFLFADAAHSLFLSIAEYKGWINTVIDSF